MDATRCLRDEHQLILKVLDCFEIALHRAEEAGRVSTATFAPFVEFFRGFADRCHHCKEEDRLFPRMEGKGIPRDGGPIGVMLMEHEQARMHVSTIAGHLEAADAGDAEASRLLHEHARAYLRLLRSHIDKEDHCLFGMADSLFASADLVELTDAYRGAEEEPEYRSTMDRCRAIADELQAEYRPATT